MTGVKKKNPNLERDWDDLTDEEREEVSNREPIDLEEVRNEALGLMPKEEDPPWNDEPVEEEDTPWEPEPIEDDDFLTSSAKGAGKALLNGVGWVGEQYDRYAGAPARNALGALQDKKNPITAYAEQFGENPRSAPTGKRLAEKAGFSSEPYMSKKFPYMYGEGRPLTKGGLLDPSKSGAAGLAIDIAADPTNVVGMGAVVAGGKAAGKGLLKLAKPVVKGAGALSDAATGTKVAERTGGMLAKTGETIGDVKRYFTPSQADDYGEMVTLSKRNNINPENLPESVEFGENSFISRAARQRAEDVGGAKYADQFDQSHGQVQKAITDKVKHIGGGQALDRVSAGKVLREGYNQGVDDFFNKMDVTYSSVHKMVPGLTISAKQAPKLDSAMNGIEKFVKGLKRRPITGTDIEQANQLQRVVDTYRKTKGNFKQTVEAMQRVGKYAFGSHPGGADIPVDKKKMQDIYYAMSDALVGTTDEISPELGKSLRANNELMTSFFGDKSQIAKLAQDSRLAPEKLFNSLVLEGDTEKIKALKNILPPESFKRLKAAAVEALIKRDPDEAFTFRALHNALRNKESIFTELLDPEELGELRDLVRLGDRFGPKYMSSSQTSASGFFSNPIKAVGRVVSNDKIIESAKAHARGKGVEIPKGLLPSTQGNAKFPIQGRTSEAPTGFLRKEQPKGWRTTPLRKRGPKEKRLKAAQVYSVGRKKEDEDE